MSLVELRSGSGMAPALARQLRILPASRLERKPRFLPVGVPVVDRFLPSKGLYQGGINEWVGGPGKSTLAARCLAFHSHHASVAWLSPHPLLNPLVLDWMGARFENIHFGIQRQADRFTWMIEQVVSSGVFPLVVIYGSFLNKGAPLLDPPAYRHLLAGVKRHQTVLVLLLEDHPSLPFLARTCSLRIRFEGVASRSPLSAPPTCEDSQGPLMQLTVERAAGFAPGATLQIPRACVGGLE